MTRFAITLSALTLPALIVFLGIMAAVFDFSASPKAEGGET